MCQFNLDGVFSFGDDGKCAGPSCLQDEAVLSPRMPFFVGEKDGASACMLRFDAQKPEGLIFARFAGRGCRQGADVLNMRVTWHGPNCVLSAHVYHLIHDCFT